MSYSNKIKYLAVDRSKLNRTTLHDKTKKELAIIMNNILSQKIHGISFSPYLEDQDPGLESVITEKQIKQRLQIIQPYTRWIRTFSCTNGNELTPKIAHEMGLKTLVGAWLGSDLEKNEEEINNAIFIARNGYADILAIGNEVLLREDLTVEELIGYIKRVKNELPNIQIGYVDAYYTFANYPEIADLCDVILANCYPFWEYCSLETSVDYMKHMYKLAQSVSKGKKVIISETGWPSKGSRFGEAVPTLKNAMDYFIQTYQWTQAENIDVFYFSSFDEIWKAGHEGEYGAFWGLWDKDGKYKFDY
ncbi:MAG: hypothetical protein JXC31_04320 [Acholeplasmataceae bacterium]|nr:hypothetical protein [Acholeplasmataceae bacterium]